MMLAIWLIEIYLSKCNTLEDILAAESTTSDVESLTIERQMMEEDMRNFMTTYQVCCLSVSRIDSGAVVLINIERP